MSKHLFISLLCIIFSLTTTYSQPEWIMIDGIAGIVGKNIVLNSEVEIQYVQEIMQETSASTGLKCEIFEELLLQKMFLAQAQIDSIVVAENQVENELERRLRFFINQIGSREKLEEYYNKSILEIKDEFRTLVRDQLLIQEIQRQITEDVKVTPSEVSRFFNSLIYDSIPDIETEYQLQHIIIKPSISDESQQEIKQRLSNIRERVIKEDNFAALAVMYSEDPGSARKGGELGFFERGEMFAEFEAAAFNLKKQRDISPVIKTKAGYHILQLIERRGELINVRHILLQIKPGVEALANAKTIADSIYSIIDAGEMTFEDAVKTFSQHPSAKQGGFMINPYTMNDKFYASQLDPQVLFAIKDLPEGSFTRPIAFKDEENKDAFRIIRIVKKIPPHKANLKDDYPVIQEIALRNKKQQRISEWIEEKKTFTFIKIHEPFVDCNFIYKW